MDASLRNSSAILCKLDNGIIGRITKSNFEYPKGDIPWNEVHTVLMPVWPSVVVLFSRELNFKLVF